MNASTRRGRDAAASVPLRARAFVLLQHLLPRRGLSRAVHALTRSRRSWLRRLVTRVFVARFPIDMQEAAEPDPYAYPSFNAFFTRALRPGVRPQPADATLVTSPADGTLQQADPINDQHVVQAKGQRYPLRTLLADHPLTARYAGGSACTVYLAPYNYHRVHMPCTGTLVAWSHVPGDLYSVNAATAAALPGLFARNERVVCHFESDAGAFAVVLVGAMNVGSIETVWAGEITGDHRRAPVRHVDVPRDADQRVTLQRGDEVGRFNMGSTVIVLLPPDAASLLEGHAPGNTVRVGTPLARWHA